MDTSETKNIIRPEKRGVEYESILKKTAKEGAIVSKVSCWRLHRTFAPKIDVIQWWLRKKKDDAFFLFQNRHFKGIFHYVGPEL